MTRPAHLLIVASVTGGVVGLIAGLVAGTLGTRGADPAWLESVGTIAAAVVAAAAAVSALAIAGRDRENANSQARIDRQHANLLSVIANTEARYRDVQELLIAFDRYVGLRWIEVLTEETDKDRWRSEAADFTGRLRASTEELPKTRHITASHSFPTEVELGSWLEAYVEELGELGNPEVEPTEVLVVRGELLTQRNFLLDEIADQRAELSGTN